MATRVFIRFVGCELSLSFFNSIMARAFQRLRSKSRNAKPACKRSWMFLVSVVPFVVVSEIMLRPRNDQASDKRAAKPIVPRMLSPLVEPRHSDRADAFQFS